MEFRFLFGALLVAALAGCSGGNALDTAEVYDPDTDTWTQTSPLEVARYAHTATKLSDGRVVVVGGIVYAVGEAVENVAVGDEVIVHHGHWNPDDPWIKAGKDPMLAPSAAIWAIRRSIRCFSILKSGMP